MPLRMLNTHWFFKPNSYGQQKKRITVGLIKVARTISDIAGSESIEAEYIAEAVGYRSLDRNER